MAVAIGYAVRDGSCRQMSSYNKYSCTNVDLEADFLQQHTVELCFLFYIQSYSVLQRVAGLR